MVNRRDFMKQAVLATAAGAAASAQTKPLRCGLLGINHAHAIDLYQMACASDAWEVAGICEPNPGVKSRFERWPELKDAHWLSQEELLQDDTVAMVAIESDVPRLLELAEAAVEAGKHIHLDKPAGYDLPRFKALLDRAQEKKLLVQMGYMFRYNPGFDLIRQAVREGWLGPIYSIQASMCTRLGEDKRGRMTFHPGGAMLELGCHLIDMIVLLLGEPEKVTPFLHHDGPFDDTFADNTLAVLEYNHALVSVEIAAMEPRAFEKRRFKIAGDQGLMILEPLEPPILDICLEEEAGGFPKGRTRNELPDLHRHLRDLDDFARCIRGEAEFAYPKTHDLAVQRTILRACGETV